MDFIEATADCSDDVESHMAFSTLHIIVSLLKGAAAIAIHPNTHSMTTERLF